MILRNRISQLHIKDIYTDRELEDVSATHNDFLLVPQEGKRNVQRHIAHYNLDIIIALPLWQLAVHHPQRRHNQSRKKNKSLETFEKSNIQTPFPYRSSIGSRSIPYRSSLLIRSRFVPGSFGHRSRSGKYRTSNESATKDRPKVLSICM